MHIYIDIETAAGKEHLSDCSNAIQDMWVKKATRQYPELPLHDSYSQMAAIFPEFGRIVCISVGYVKGNELKIKSYYGEDEVQLLNDFTKDMDKIRPTYVGHNIFNFDLPYIGKRCIINRLPIPNGVDTRNMKPWEIPHIDTMKMWSFGVFNANVSLATLASAFGLPTSKDDIDGSEVSNCYYNGEIERIKTYCEKDVVLTQQIHEFMIGGD
jgi:predicted PolB exonuclease-like 3'-5' exonuclease